MSGSPHLGIPDIRDVPVWVYALSDPRTALIRYVGKSARPFSRFANHRSYSAAKAVREWVAELRELGAEPTVILLRCVPPGEDSDIYERAFIDIFFPDGALLNNRLSSRFCGPGTREFEPIDHSRLASFADRVRYLMNRKSISFFEIHKLVGLHSAEASDIFWGRAEPTSDQMIDFASVLGVQVAWLTSGRGRMTAPATGSAA